MGRWKAWALAWLLAATLSALLLQVPSARGDELLANGGFEDGVAHWIAKGGAFQAVDGLGRDDSAAGVSVADGSSYHYVGQCVPAWGSNPYTFQGYAAGPNETLLVSAYLLISWYSGVECHGEELGTTGDTAEAIILEPSNMWHPLTLDVGAAPAATRSARVGIVIEQSDATVYLDDFSFSGPPAPTPTASPSPPTQTPPPTVSPSPSPGPAASPSPRPTATPSPTAVPTATPLLSAPDAWLVNGGFEEADGEGRPLGWRKYGGELRRSSAAKWEGQFAAAFSSQTASTKWAFQTVAVEGGDAYVLSGYALKNDANIESAYLRLSWYASLDGSGQAIDSVDSTIRLVDDWPDFRFLTTGPVVAPAEAASAKVRLMLDPLSEREGKVYFDDISFEETIMPSPSPEATQTPLSPASDARRGLAPSVVTPTAPAGEPQAPSSPTVLHPSPTVLGATLDAPEAIASDRDGVAQREAGSEGTSSRRPVLLYRERKAALSTEGGESVAAEADEGAGLSPSVLILVMAPSAATAAAAALFVWRRSQKRARPP